MVSGLLKAIVRSNQKGWRGVLNCPAPLHLLSIANLFSQENFLFTKLVGLLTVGYLLTVGLSCYAQNASGGAAVLLFHAVEPAVKTNEAIVSSQDLAATLDLLKKNGFNFINLKQLHDYLEGKGSVPPRAVLVAFDDGYADNYLHAHAVLASRNVPAVVFPVTKWFSPYPRLEPARPHLTSEQARAMLASGVWEFGSHTYDGHRKIGGRAWLLRSPGESLEDYRARVWADLILSKHELERLGVSVVDFAPPYGAYDGELLKLLQEAGFKYVHVQQEKLNCPGQGPFIYRIEARSPEQVVRTLEMLFRQVTEG